MILAFPAASTILLNLSQHRETLYVIFGICCLIAWLLFNFWALREYFCPMCFDSKYTPGGLNRRKLDEKTKEFLDKARHSNSILIAYEITSGDTSVDDLSITEMTHPQVFLDIEADGESLGRLVFELNSTVCPRTSENFRLLCTGEKGFGLKDCLFYRVIPGFCACSGDFETQNIDRKGGKSALGTKYFDDENFTIKHDKRGILSMDNYGWPNTNSSRFFVTFKEAPWMNNFHVAFGSLIDGFDVLDEIEQLGVIEGSGAQKGRTIKTIKIADCGQI